MRKPYERSYSVISFCTVVLDRSEDLQETLRFNMGANPDAEFIVLDYGSTDNVLRWIGHELHRLPPVRRFAVYRLKQARGFNSAHSKNVAHRLATGSVLVNLDADNYTGEGYSEAIGELLNANGFYVTMLEAQKPFCIIPKNRLRTYELFSGAGGRIVVTRAAFNLVRGYDESLEGYGYDDTEFAARLRNAGAHMLEIDRPESLRHIHTSEEKRHAHFTTDPSVQFNNNRDAYMRCVIRQTKVANVGVEYGAGEVELIYELDYRDE